jgi:hypothetical protein
LNTTPASIEHHDCRQMASALDGLAGTLHTGEHIDAKDLRSLSESAQWVWDAGPQPEPARDAQFRAARKTFDDASAGCAQQFAKEASIVRREAQSMARQLRLMASETRRLPARQELPSAVDEAIHGLVVRFARHAGNRTN